MRLAGFGRHVKRNVSVMFRQQRLENFLQRAAPAQYAGFYGADAALQNFGDFLVAEAFQIAKNYGHAENVRHALQRRLHGVLHFLRGKLFERRGAQIFDINVGVTFFGFRINGNIFLQVAFEPALVIQRFPDGDAIKPGFEGTAVTEAANSAESFEKNFLSAIGGIAGISQDSEDYVVDRGVIVGDQPVEGRF